MLLAGQRLELSDAKLGVSLFSNRGFADDAHAVDRQ